MSETCKFADVDSHLVKMQKIQNLRFSFSGVVKKYRLAQAAFGKSVVRSIVASKQAAAHDIFSLRFFSNIRKLDIEFKTNQINNLTKQVILRDGKRVYANNNTEEKIKAEVIEYSMNKYQFLDEYYEIYKSFIEHLTEVHNKEVVLVLTPYHLPSYKITIKKKPFYLDLEAKFKKLSKETNIKIIGSYEASSIPCDENEFYDYMHPKNTCMKKIINSIN